MVYIQSDNERKLPHHFDAACAFFGALESGEEVRLTSIEEVQFGKFDLLVGQRVFVGSVDFMTTVFGRAGIVPPTMPPAQQAERLSISEAIGRVGTGQKLFIKPVQTKLFSGMVVDGDSVFSLQKFLSETEVWIAHPFESTLVSEWRCYIWNDSIMDCRNYSGDFKIAPSFDWAGQQLLSGNARLCCYTMDIGILKNGANVVVEYNDMWAIGNYGLENSVYFQMLRDRYFEMVR
jgi:hypothetical protein